jgi:two-component sensor histidine kinase
MLSERKVRQSFGWLGRISDRLPPLSLSAFAFALLLTACATVLREGFGLFGSTLYFAAYYPTVLVIALVAGAPAAAFGIAVSVVVAYWAFIPPRYGFAPVSLENAANVFLFVVSAGLIVWVAEAYRRAMRAMTAQERERELLIRELEHRSRNMLTIIESIIRSSAGPNSTLADAMIGRIHALSIGNEIVIHSRLKPVPFRAVLENGLRPYDQSRWSLHGEEIELPGDAARVTALIVHELATNAAKYGGLKDDGGTLSVTWTKRDDEVDVSWTETTQHPVAEPTAYGFGTKLVRRCLKRLDGTLEPNFKPEGLVCRIRFKLRAPA